MTTAADVLGVDESATEEEIQDAFREQARRFHPDRFDPDSLDIEGIGDVDPDGLFRDVKQARDKLTSGHSGSVPLQHEWENGEPLNTGLGDDAHKRTEKTEGTDDSDEGQPDDTTKTETDTGGGANSGGDSDDSPWTSTGETEDGGLDDTIGVEIEDGPEDSVSIGGSQTNGIMSRRNLLTAVGVGGGGLVAANWLGLLSSDSDPDSEGTNSDPDSNSNSGRSTEHAVVGSSETIQEAADRVIPGGTLEIPSGSYSEYLSVDVDMSIVAPDGATFLGDSADVTAISVSDVDVEIEGLTIGNYDGGGIHGGGPDSEISITNVTIEDSGTNGLNVTGEQIDLNGVVSRENIGTGFHLTSTDTGAVSVTNAVASSNTDPSAGDEASGIVITGGEEVAVQETEATENKSTNILVERGEASAQSVEIMNSFAAASSSASGVRIAGTYGEDDVTIQNTESVDNTQRGVVVGSEHPIDAMTLETVTVRDNGGTGMRLMSTESGEVSVTNAVVTGNTDPYVMDDAKGIVVGGGKEISIQGSEATENEYANVVVEPGDARGQNIEIKNSLLAGSSAASGVRIKGSYGEDSLVFESTRSIDNQKYGFDLGGESIRIVDCEASNNDDGTLNLRDIDREEAEIQNSF